MPKRFGICHPYGPGDQVSLGEMISYLTVAGGHIKLAERFVDPAFSFALGWNYWYNWTIGLPAELTAAAVLMQYWKDVSSFSLLLYNILCHAKSFFPLELSNNYVSSPNLP